MKFQLSAILFSFALAPLLAPAQSNKSAPPALPFSYQREAGKPVQLNFRDGRKAGLFVATKKATYFTPFTTGENTCTDTQKPKCFFITHNVSYSYGLKWLSHSDTKKIDQWISLKQNPSSALSEDQLRQQNLITGTGELNQQFGIPYALDLQCDRYDWLPNSEADSPPEKLNIPRWSAVTMATNPETGVNEVRAKGDLLDVTLSKISEDKEVRLGIRASYQTSSSMTVTPSNEVQWVLIQKNGQPCQIELTMREIDMADWSKINQVITFEKSQTFEHKPYIWGQDSLILFMNGPKLIPSEYDFDKKENP